MMQLIRDGSFGGVEIIHVRMNFSREMSEARRPSARKALHLVEILFRIAIARFKRKATVIYYPPSGPSVLPMLRDVVILASTRWMFRTTIFHFQAGGLSEGYTGSPWFMKPLFRMAYFGAQVGIELSDSSPRDGTALQAKRVLIIPNACPDEAGVTGRLDEVDQAMSTTQYTPEILFVGVLRESKGVLDLLRACAVLHERGLQFRLKLMGSYESISFRKRMLQMASDLGIPDIVQVLGVKTGGEKSQEFRSARLLCLPSFFDSESFPVCIVEAMMFGVPVVATNWRGIPSLVRDGETGFLVRVGDVSALAQRVGQLLDDVGLARRMGKAGRALYAEYYTASRFHEQIQEVFDGVARN
jgi:glycosyltransferase involved in cell wall biosynthesis